MENYLSGEFQAAAPHVATAPAAKSERLRTAAIIGGGVASLAAAIGLAVLVNTKAQANSDANHAAYENAGLDYHTRTRTYPSP